MDKLKNPYPGINAHLNSKLQNKGGWSDFHTNHIADLTRLLKAQLAPKGYTAVAEQGLQIRHFGEWVRAPKSDVLVYDPDPMGAYTAPLPRTGSPQELMLTIPELLNVSEDDYYQAVIVYEIEPDNTERGEPIVWIELLSPTNKVG